MNIEKWFEKYNFSKDDIELYYKFPGKNNFISDKTFMKCYEGASDELIRLGFSKEDAKKILILNRCNVTIKQKYEERINILKTLFNDNNSHNINITSRYLKYNKETIISKIELLKSNNFSQKEIIKLLNGNIRFFTHTLEDINKHIDLFKKYNVPNNKIKKIFINNSYRIFKLKQEDEKQTIDLLSDIGFSKNEIYNIISNFAKILIIEKDTIKSVFNLFENYIGSKEKTLTFFTNKPNLFDYNKKIYNQMKDELVTIGLNEKEIKNVTLKANEIIMCKYNKVSMIKKAFEELGFEIKDIKAIIILNPKILYHDSNKINEIYKTLKNNNLNHQEITDIFLKYPNVIESNCQSLDDKIKLLSRLDILNLTLINPKNLIQGCEKTYLRYLYVFNVLEEEITDKNIGLIYASNNKRVPQIDILRAFYSYKDDMENTFEKRLENKEKQHIKIKCYGGY